MATLKSLNPKAGYLIIEDLEARDTNPFPIRTHIVEPKPLGNVTKTIIEMEEFHYPNMAAAGAAGRNEIDNTFALEGSDDGSVRPQLPGAKQTGDHHSVAPRSLTSHSSAGSSRRSQQSNAESMPISRCLGGPPVQYGVEVLSYQGSILTSVSSTATKCWYSQSRSTTTEFTDAVPFCNNVKIKCCVIS